MRNIDLLRLRQRLDIVGGFCIEIDEPGGIPAADRDLVHVGVRRMQQAAALGHREHGERIRHRLGAKRRPFQRIERNVDLRSLAGADLFADEEHRRLIALAFADDDGAVDVEPVQLRAHCVDSRLVRRLFVAASRQKRRKHRRPHDRN